MALEGIWGYDGLRSSYSFELIGRKAAVRLDPLQVVAERAGQPVDLTPTDVPPGNWGASVAALLRDAVEAVREGRPPSITHAQALAVQRIQDAIYRSAETGREERLTGCTG
jgi:predicted dehydrogenase